MLTSLEFKLLDKAKHTFLELNMEDQNYLLIKFLEKLYMEENNLTPKNYIFDDFIYYLSKNNFIELLDKHNKGYYMKVKTIEIEKKFNKTLPNIIIPFIFAKYKYKVIEYFKTHGKNIFHEMAIAEIYCKHGHSDILKNKLRHHHESITDFEADLMFKEIFNIYEENDLGKVIEISEDNLESLNINHKKILLRTLVFSIRSILDIEINLMEAEEFFNSEFGDLDKQQNTAKKEVLL